MKANHKSDLSEMSALSVITLLPSNEQELASFKAKLKSEVLIHHDPLSVYKQLQWCLRTIAECLEDYDIKRRFMLEAFTYGEEYFRHYDTNYHVNPETGELRMEL